MSELSDALKKYLSETSEEKILEDWAKTEKYDKIGPTVEDFLKETKTKNDLR